MINSKIINVKNVYIYVLTSGSKVASDNKMLTFATRNVICNFRENSD